MLNQPSIPKVFQIAQSLTLCLMLVNLLIVPSYTNQPGSMDVNYELNQDCTIYNKDKMIFMQMSLEHLAKDYPDSSKLLYVLNIFYIKKILHSYIEKWLEVNRIKASPSTILKPLIDLLLLDAINTIEHHKHIYLMHRRSIYPFYCSKITF